MIKIQILGIVFTLLFSAISNAQGSNELPPFECVQATPSQKHFTIQSHSIQGVSRILMKEWLVNSVVREYTFTLDGAVHEGDVVLVLSATEEVLGGNEFSKLELRLATLTGQNPATAKLQKYRLNQKIGEPLEIDFMCRLGR